MFDTDRTRTLLAPADPARGVTVPAPRATAAELIARAEAAAPPRLGVRRRRILVPVAAGLVAAGLVGAGIVAATGRPPRDGRPDATAKVPALGPVVRPVAFEFRQGAPPAGDRLRALAAQLTAAPYDTTSGRYTHIHTIDWNAVFDDAPGGNAQRIQPVDKHRWYAADGSGRIRTENLAAVYPNEQSYRYYQRDPAENPTATPGPRDDDLPAGLAGPAQPLTSDPAELARRLADHPFWTVRDIYSVYAVPLATRAELLRILATTPGVVWRGETTDRLGRRGVAVSVEAATTEEVLVFDPTTGVLLAWDEVEHPTDTVAGAFLYLSYEHTDRLG
jgi:hypothetical protein